MTACSPFLFTGSGRISDIYKVSVPSPEKKMCLVLNCCSALKIDFQLGLNEGPGSDVNALPVAAWNGLLPTAHTKGSLACHIFSLGSQIFKHMHNSFCLSGDSDVWDLIFASYFENFHKKESACKTTKMYFSASCGKIVCMAILILAKSLH